MSFSSLLAAVWVGPPNAPFPRPQLRDAWEPKSRGRVTRLQTRGAARVRAAPGLALPLPPPPPPPPRQQRAARARVYVPRGAADVTAEWQHCGGAETRGLGIACVLILAGSPLSAGGKRGGGEVGPGERRTRASARSPAAPRRPVRWPRARRCRRERLVNRSGRT